MNNSKVSVLCPSAPQANFAHQKGEYHEPTHPSQGQQHLKNFKNLKFHVSLLKNRVLVPRSCRSTTIRQLIINDNIFNLKNVLIKGAPNLYFMHYLCVVIILLNTGLYKSAFYTCFFRKLICHLSPVFSVCSVCFVFVVIFVDLITFVLSFFKLVPGALLFRSHFVRTIWCENIKVVLQKFDYNL